MGWDTNSSLLHEACKSNLPFCLITYAAQQTLIPALALYVGTGHEVQIWTNVDKIPTKTGLAHSATCL